MEIVIILTDREETIIKKLAELAGLPPPEYGENIVRHYLKGQIEGEFQKKFNEKTEDELAVIFGEIKA